MPEPVEYPAINLFTLSESIYRVYLAAGTLLEPRTLSPDATVHVQLAIAALVNARLNIRMALHLRPYPPTDDEQPTPIEPSLDVHAVRDRIVDLHGSAQVDLVFDEDGVPPTTLGHVHLALNALWTARIHIDAAVRS
jgi:hypothetical protein